MIDAEFRLKDISRILKKGGLLFLKDHDIITEDDADNVTFEHFVYSIGEGKATVDDANKYNKIEPMYYYSEQQVTIFLELLGFKQIYLDKFKNPTKTYMTVYKKL
jgi:hypothetical protein